MVAIESVHRSEHAGHSPGCTPKRIITLRGRWLAVDERKITLYGLITCSHACSVLQSTPWEFVPNDANFNWKSIKLDLRSVA